MKKSLYLLPLLGLALVGCSKQDTDKAKADAQAAADKTAEVAKDAAAKTKEVATEAAAKTKETAVEVKDAVAAKIVEWKLTPADLKADLEKGGGIVRNKTLAAGEVIGEVADNARIVTVINAKLVGDPLLSYWKIDVDADKGTVTLKGTVSTPEAVGRAMALALDTNGVSQVTSFLTIK